MGHMCVVILINPLNPNLRDWVRRKFKRFLNTLWYLVSVNYLELIKINFDVYMGDELNLGYGGG